MVRFELKNIANLQNQKQYVFKTSKCIDTIPNTCSAVHCNTNFLLTDQYETSLKFLIVFTFTLAVHFAIYLHPVGFANNKSYNITAINDILYIVVAFGNCQLTQCYSQRPRWLAELQVFFGTWGPGVKCCWFTMQNALTYRGGVWGPAYKMHNDYLPAPWFSIDLLILLYDLLKRG